MKKYILILIVGILPHIIKAQCLDSTIISQIINLKASPFKTDTLTLTFIGDIMMHKGQINKDYKPFLKDLTPLFASSDLNIANMELTLAGKPYTGYPCFSAPDYYADYVHKAGINVFLTANNHILDKGTLGLKRTINQYDRLEQNHKLRYTGISKSIQDDSTRNPLIIRHKSIKIALLNFTYGTNVGQQDKLPIINYIDTNRLNLLINRAKQQEVDYIIACPHWGEEYRLTHNKAQERLAKWLVSKGINLIIGAHPHVIQDMQELTHNNQKVKVYYSLGNAVSNMSAPNTQLELLLKVKIVKDFNKKIRLLSIVPYYLWCTLPNTICDSYKVLILKDAIQKPQIWKNRNDYHKMINTYKRVKEVSKIQDN